MAAASRIEAVRARVLARVVHAAAAVGNAGDIAGRADAERQAEVSTGGGAGSDGHNAITAITASAGTASHCIEEGWLRAEQRGATYGDAQETRGPTACHEDEARGQSVPARRRIRNKRPAQGAALVDAATAVHRGKARAVPAGDTETCEAVSGGHSHPGSRAVRARCDAFYIGDDDLGVKDVLSVCERTSEGTEAAPAPEVTATVEQTIDESDGGTVHGCGANVEAGTDTGRENVRGSAPADRSGSAAAAVYGAMRRRRAERLGDGGGTPAVGSASSTTPLRHIAGKRSEQSAMAEGSGLVKRRRLRFKTSASAT